MNIKQLLYGISTFVPGLAHFHAKGTGGSCSARYCYSVWLRHLTLAYKNGKFKSLPQNVGELGPGDSIGIGIAALLSGVKSYHGLDIVEHASLSGNLEVFQNLITLFKNKEPIPNEQEFPNLKPVLENYDFPDFILDNAKLEKSLASDHLQKIEDSIKHPNESKSLIKYSAPWQSSEKIQKSSLDWIFSQAVLEHIDELELTYKAMKSWLKPDGFISHQIDFKCHGLTKEWNGHWVVPEYLWFLLRGKRPYLLNRLPLSAHLELLQQNGFKLIAKQLVEKPSKFSQYSINPKLRIMTEEDITTSGAFIMASLD